MAKLIKKYDRNFTIFANGIFKDKRLSYKELGLLVQLLSLPDNWEFNVKGITKLHKDGEDSVKAGLVKLEEYGYLTRVRTRDDNGKLSSSDYFIYDNPEDNKQFVNKGLNKEFLPRGENPPMAGDPPVGENPPVENPPVEKPANKEYIYKESINKESSTSTKNIPFSEEEWKSKIEYEGFYFSPKQFREVNKLVNEADKLSTTKDNILFFLGRLYDNKLRMFKIADTEIYNLYGFVKSAFTGKITKDAEKQKELIDKFKEENNDLFQTEYDNEIVNRQPVDLTEVEEWLKTRNSLS